MPLLYGEGTTRAFRRLQKEYLAIHDDVSVFAWNRVPQGFRHAHGKRDNVWRPPLLATLPSDFKGCGAMQLNNSAGNPLIPNIISSGVELRLAIPKTILKTARKTRIYYRLPCSAGSESLYIQLDLHYSAGSHFVEGVVDYYKSSSVLCLRLDELVDYFSPGLYYEVAHCLIIDMARPHGKGGPWENKPPLMGTAKKLGLRAFWRAVKLRSDSLSYPRTIVLDEMPD